MEKQERIFTSDLIILKNIPIPGRKWGKQRNSKYLLYHTLFKNMNIGDCFYMTIKPSKRTTPTEINTMYRIAKFYRIANKKTNLYCFTISARKISDTRYGIWRTK